MSFSVGLITAKFRLPSGFVNDIKVPPPNRPAVMPTPA